VRSVQAPHLMERFLVSAIVAVLLIRAYLTLTGFPQMGGHGLHIAHMLFGGLGMLIALLASLTLLGPRVRVFAATVGGAGFGTFIDELGKFITSNNNYFFQPTVSLIYVIFVLLFIAGERLGNEANPTRQERLAQATDVITGAVVDGYPVGVRDVAMKLLKESDAANPIVPALQGALARIDAAPDPRPGLTAVTSRRVADAYAWLVEQGWFLRLVLTIATVAAVFSLRQLSVTILADTSNSRVQLYLDSTGGLLLLANVVAGVLLLIGLLRLHGSRLTAYHWFRRAVLVSLLMGQPLAFYAQQWTALLGLGLNLLLLSAVEYGMTRESALALVPKSGDTECG
jgi:hypothetical protein